MCRRGGQLDGEHVDAAGHLRHQLGHRSGDPDAQGRPVVPEVAHLGTPLVQDGQDTVQRRGGGEADEHLHGVLPCQESKNPFRPWA